MNRIPTRVALESGDPLATRAGAVALFRPSRPASRRTRRGPDGAGQGLDRLTGGQYRYAIERGLFEGKAREVLPLYPTGGRGPERVLLVGLGKRSELDLEKWRCAVAEATRAALRLGATTLALDVPPEAETGLASAGAAVAAVDAALLAEYRYDHLKRQDEEDRAPRALTRLQLHGAGTGAALRSEVESARVVAEATWLCRDLSNHPGNVSTPTYLANTARRLAREARFRCRVLGRAEMRREGMGAILGVAQGSDEPPRFIILEYEPRGRGRGRRGPRVGLVGKGITFDSGGISIKPAERMDEMKHDMSGGAAVIATLWAVARLRLPVRLVGLVPCTENLSGGRAYKPGDVLRARNGKTIEVVNTDAEGRLILADALSYASRYKPDAVIDLATLTGACMVALGSEASGLFSRDDALAARLIAAGEAAGERLWRLPLWDEYRKLVKSKVADVKNSGGRYGGAISAACFLSEFAEGYPWAHVDIAGTAWGDTPRPYQVHGATGVGVRLLVHALRSWPAGKARTRTRG